MTRILFTTILFSTIFGFSIAAENTEAIKNDLSKLVKNFGKEHGIPCFVAGFVKKQELSGYEHFFDHSDGFADLENHVKCSSSVMLRVASVSKAMESILTAKYVENGTVTWDDDVHKWISEEHFPKKTWNHKEVKTTLRQLIMHQSGIRGKFLWFF